MRLPSPPLCRSCVDTFQSLWENSKRRGGWVCSQPRPGVDPPAPATSSCGALSRRPFIWGHVASALTCALEPALLERTRFLCRKSCCGLPDAECAGGGLRSGLSRAGLSRLHAPWTAPHFMCTFWGNSSSTGRGSDCPPKRRRAASPPGCGVQRVEPPVFSVLARHRSAWSLSSGFPSFLGR